MRERRAGWIRKKMVLVLIVRGLDSSIERSRDEGRPDDKSYLVVNRTWVRMYIREIVVQFKSSKYGGNSSTAVTLTAVTMRYRGGIWGVRG